MADVKDCDLVVEAVVEQLDVKQADLPGARRDRRRRTRCWRPTPRRCRSPRSPPRPSHPGRVIGVHFFNPAPVQNLVEIIRTVVTEPEVLEDVAELARVARQDTRSSSATRPASSPTRCCSATSTTRSRCTRASYASREDIDAAMRFGCGYPMGPLALLDLIGLDTAYEILDTMYRQGRDRLHAPAPILKQMVTAGLLGRKTGRGFYTYEAPDSPVVVDDDLTPSRRRRSRSCATTSRRVGVVGTGTMATGIVEVFAKAGYDGHVRRPQPGQGRRRSARRSSGRWTRPIQRGKLEESARERGARPAAPARPRSTTSPTSTSSSRRSPRT